MNKFGDKSFNGNRNSSINDFRSVEKHKAVCADCKQDCEVPFKPREGRPVYCKECYPKHRKNY